VSDAPKKPGLTLKQRRFVEEYAADPNAVQAYFRAFGRLTSKGKRRTYGGAAKSAQRLLQNDAILSELSAALDAWRKRVEVTKERVLAEVAALAFADPDDLYEPDEDNRGLPKARAWRDIPVAARKALQSVKIKRRRLVSDEDETAWEVEEVEYRHHSKPAELDKLCKRLGFYDQDVAAELAALRAQLEAMRGTPTGGTGPTPRPQA
jgi:phage terminase small subunit